MKIELKRIHFSERMSEETNCFVADLYINGIKVGEAKNEGHGGSTDYYSNGKPESNKLIKDAEKHFLSLPKEKPEGYNFELQPTLEGAIDDFLEKYLQDKFDQKIQRKLEKSMETSIMFGVPGGSEYRFMHWGQKGKVPLSKVPIDILQKKVDEIRKEYCKNGVVILNTNLEKLGVK